MARVHVPVERISIAQFLCGSDHIRIYGVRCVVDGDVDGTARAVDLYLDLIARIVVINRWNETLDLVFDVNEDS